MMTTRRLERISLSQMQEWLAPYAPDQDKLLAVTLTYNRKKGMRQVPSGSVERFDEQVASDHLWKLLQRMNRHAFKGKSKPRRGGLKLYFVPFMEGSVASSIDLHVHAILEIPEGQTAKDWSDKLQEEWLKMQWGGLVHTQPVDDIERWFGYMCKSRTKSGPLSDSLDTKALSLGRKGNHFSIRRPKRSQVAQSANQTSPELRLH